jgi:hypothetical protein
MLRARTRRKKKRKVQLRLGALGTFEGSLSDASSPSTPIFAFAHVSTWWKALDEIKNRLSNSSVQEISLKSRRFGILNTILWRQTKIERFFTKIAAKSTPNFMKVVRISKNMFGTTCAKDH